MSENCGRVPVALYHLSKNCCSVETRQRLQHQHEAQQQHQPSLPKLLFNGGKLMHRWADALRAESWVSEVKIGNPSSNPSSEIGGLKALASHGSKGSSRERALARSLASSLLMSL